MVKEKITLTIEKDIRNGFAKYCKERGMKVSSKVEILMKEELKKE